LYPTLLKIGSFEISTFGAMMVVGVLAALWVFRRELSRSAMPLQAADVAATAVLAGLVGAKILWVVEHRHEDSLLSLLTSRGGMSWFGGLAAGLLVGVSGIVRRGWPLMPILSAACPAVAIGQALGRVGCFLVGDDYGLPTDLPWGVAFPQGLPPTAIAVHPTQLYETGLLLGLAAALVRWRRRGAHDHVVVAAFLALAGAIRFSIEFIRVDRPVALGLTVAHWASLASFVMGVLLAMANRKRPFAMPVEP
jgi:phosphatidylglycerol---prolipoprotein diacylglyceryl transferase